MTRRLRVSLLIAATGCAVGAVYGLWPASGPLPAKALGGRRGPLYVVRVEPVCDESVHALVEAVAPWFPLDVRATSEWAVDERHKLSWDGDVYDADELIRQLLERIPRGTLVMGITDQAMHDEESWWLYGKGAQATLVSTAHLWVDDAEGDTKHPLFRQRLAKVAVHEVGHNLGFWHCGDPRCVMTPTANLDELDYSRVTFCRACLRNCASWH